MCHQDTWWAAQWDGKGTATRVQTHTPETRTATHWQQGTVSDSPHQPPPSTLVGTQNGLASDSGCPDHRHHSRHHVARPGPQRGSLRAQAWDAADVTLDVMDHRPGTDYQDLHCQPANPGQQDAGHARAQGRARTGIQHVPRSQRPQAGPPTSAGTVRSKPWP